MTPRVLIPTEDVEGKVMAGHFGRAPYFAIFDTDESNNVVLTNVYPNTGSHQGGEGHAHDNVLEMNPNVIIVNGMGPRGIKRFQDSNVAVLRASSNSIGSILEAYSKGALTELTEGCSDAHHK